ncbi:TOBE domain-containing protein [Komagataeibacter rhaeticus]|nr:TOBE domain-containing protein [Komagataeibacter rhaeticus]
MFGGRVAQVAPPRDLYECPGSLQVASFVGQANYLAGHVAHDNGQLAVVTPLGTRPLDGRSAITAPAPARNILIRPESICITPPAASDAVPATVISVQYGGNLTNYVLALADGQQLHVQTATPPSHTGGDRVGVRLADAPCGLSRIAGHEKISADPAGYRGPAGFPGHSVYRHHLHQPAPCR